MLELFEPASTYSTRQGRSLDVLLIEDNPVDAHLVDATLEAQPAPSFVVTTVSSLAKGLSALQVCSFDLILLDLYLSDSSGLEGLQRIQSDFPRTPVVVLTGCDDEALAVRALQSGAQDYLVKGASLQDTVPRAVRYAVERQRLHLELLDMQSEIFKKRQLESVGVIAAGLSHDFNNLLTSMLLHLRLMRKLLEVSPEVEELVAGVEQAVRRGQALTRQMVSFARGMPAALSLASLGDVIRETADFANLGSGIPCRFDLAADLHPVLADLGQISQVVHNLVLNARQAMENTRGPIRVTAANCTAGDPPRPYVRLTVRDHGCGIEEGLLERIFDPYFTTRPEGTGLGLATCASIVRNHGGYLEVQSRPGEGTEFSVYLPARAS